MRRPLSLSYVARRPEMHSMKSGKGIRWAGARPGLSLAIGIFLGCLLLSACANPFGGAATSTPTPATQALEKISWCTSPLMVFRDEGATTPAGTATATATASPVATATATGSPTSTGTASASGTPTAGPGTPQTITDWSLVKANLGFSVYLPGTLPRGSCLVSAQATIHDPIFGGNFTIGYLLPNHASLSFSEAPLKLQNTTFQCNPTGASTTPTPAISKTPVTATPSPTPTTNPGQLCSGARNTTNIVLSGPGTTAQLQQIFNSLQPDINWIPAS